MKQKLFSPIMISCLIAGATSVAFAQARPDAGQILQESEPVVLPTPESTDILNIENPSKKEEKRAVGPKIKVSQVKFSGNTKFSEEALKEVITLTKNRSYTLVDLRRMTDQIASFYHLQGYPFAKAYVPVNPVEKGILTIMIVEGRYGQIQAIGEPKLAARAQSFLSTLTPNAVIHSRSLERAVLILNDQPGIKAAPVMRPSKEYGKGDLDVFVERNDRLVGEIGFDNAGNRYTGKYKTKLDLQANSALLWGDQLSLKGLGTNQKMWFGNLGYAAALGSKGWRSNISYAHTHYHLGKDFAYLEAHGVANIVSAGISYPMKRSEKMNVSWLLSYQHKYLRDQTDSTNTDNTKASHTVPMTIQFDRRDTFKGGGITYGSLGWTHGHLNLDNDLAAADGSSAKTEGNFDKITLDLNRLQTLPKQLIGYLHFSGQWAMNNLDSSEGFGVGGSNGVRAYPEGEGYGDEGWLMQVELRKTVRSLTSYLFYDLGAVKTNTRPWDPGQNVRHLSGIGPGFRLQKGRLNVELAAAWRTTGGAPTSDTDSEIPMVWASGKWRF